MGCNGLCDNKQNGCYKGHRTNGCGCRWIDVVVIQYRNHLNFQ
jgi:hypothetical protein